MTTIDSAGAQPARKTAAEIAAEIVDWQTKKADLQRQRAAHGQSRQALIAAEDRAGLKKHAARAAEFDYEDEIIDSKLSKLAAALAQQERVERIAALRAEVEAACTADEQAASAAHAGVPAYTAAAAEIVTFLTTTTAAWGARAARRNKVEQASRELTALGEEPIPERELPDLPRGWVGGETPVHFESYVILPAPAPAAEPLAWPAGKTLETVRPRRRPTEADAYARDSASWR
jgi:hypothetical protein